MLLAVSVTTVLKLLIKASISVPSISKTRGGANFPPLAARKNSAMLGSLSFSRLNLMKRKKKTNKKTQTQKQTNTSLQPLLWSRGLVASQFGKMHSLHLPPDPTLGEVKGWGRGRGGGGEGVCSLCGF